jgi:transcriptional regulator with XRE-family HTH domain
VTTGSRIRFHRQRAGLTQEVLAGLAGVSPSWISQVERGTRVPDSLRCLIPVAKVLRVDPMDLVGDVSEAGDRGGDGIAGGMHDLVVTLRRSQPIPAAEPNLEDIAQRLGDAERLQRHCHYRQAGTMVAALVADAEMAVSMCQHTERERVAYSWLSHAYRIAAHTLLRAGEEHSVRWIAADRCSAAAHRTGDPVAEGFAAQCRSLLFSYHGWAAEATEASVGALDRLPADAHPRLAGSLLLMGARSAACMSDRSTAHGLLRQAYAVQRRIDGDEDLFGETAVRAYALFVAITLGDASEALRLGATAPSGVYPDRAALWQMDMAYAYQMRRNPEAALHRLLEAERIAPEVIRSHAMVREMVGTMLHRREGRSTTPGLRELADRVGVLD